METSYTLPVVGVMRSCYMAKFGVPRQPGLIDEASGYVELVPPYNLPDAVRGLEQFSHVWLFFIFDRNLREGWKATVRPPRLGGDRRVGVFATRSPFRPSGMGLSAVRLERVEVRGHGVIRLHVCGHDLVDGTPIVDIKPYIPYTDAIAGASAGFAQEQPDADAVAVSVLPEAEAAFSVLRERGMTTFRSLALKVIASNPRPAYQHETGRVYGVFLSGYEVVWRMDGECAVVTAVRPAAGSPFLK